MTWGYLCAVLRRAGLKRRQLAPAGGGGEAEGKTKGDRREIFDSEESGIIKQKKWKVINMPIYMNRFLCKWLVWAW